MGSYVRMNMLEQKVLEIFLARIQRSAPNLVVDLDDVFVSSRRYTGLGFFTDFHRSELLRVGSESESYIWGDVVGNVNSLITTGYLVYINNGYLTTLEGFVCGADEWPQIIEEIEIHPYVWNPYP